jgi:hypothetical protein
MSQENVEVVARLVDAWNQANVEAMLALFDPECEVIFPPEVPEPGPFHGMPTFENGLWGSSPRGSLITRRSWS